MGYAGGIQPNPTYKRIGDHSEAIQLDFDPMVLSYAELLQVFWASHTPTRQPWGRQYMAAIWWHDAEQQAVAQASQAAIVAEQGPIHTTLAPYSGFTWAEDYHQKYALRSQRTLLAELQAHYPHLPAFVNSTAVTRINAWVNGYSTAALLEAELGQCGLSTEAQHQVQAIFERYTRYSR